MKKKTAAPVVSDINVTPMVDVMLVLLIIFMVITPMLTKGVTVDEVRAKNPIAMKDADKEDAVLIAITRNGGLFLSPGNKMVQMEDIPNKVKDLLTSHLEKVVYLKVDQRAKYQVVEDVVDNLRAAGVDTLGLLVEVQAGSQAAVTPATTAAPGH